MAMARQEWLPLKLEHNGFVVDGGQWLGEDLVDVEIPSREVDCGGYECRECRVVVGRSYGSGRGPWGDGSRALHDSFNCEGNPSEPR